MFFVIFDIYISDCAPPFGTGEELTTAYGTLKHKKLKKEMHSLKIVKMTVDSAKMTKKERQKGQMNKKKTIYAK